MPFFLQTSPTFFNKTANQFKIIAVAEISSGHDLYFF